MYIANLDGNLVLVGTSVRPISSDELDGRLGRLDVIDVDRDDPSWEWLDRARRKYADDLGLPA